MDEGGLGNAFSVLSLSVSDITLLEQMLNQTAGLHPHLQLLSVSGQKVTAVNCLHHRRRY